jgi:signal transduction histidine kinase
MKDNVIMQRVLVVEDSPTQAERLRSILEAERFEVAVEPDGASALERLRHEGVDVVVSDIEMPYMSGFDLCRNIKADPLLRETPVILLSHLNEPMDIINGLSSGADNFLAKPYQPDQVVFRIRTLLQNRRLRVKTGSGSIELLFFGERFTITSEKEQILDLLMATFEDTVQTNQELRRRREELSAANDDLRRAKAAVERANRELEAFSHSVAHDLRAPLRSIGGFSEILIEEHSAELDATALGYLRHVREAAEQMSHLIDGLLELSSVSGSELSHKRVDLTQVVRSVITWLQSADPGRRVAFTVAENLATHGDPTLLRVVLENLLGNAWKFTSKRAGARIEVGSTAADGEQVFFVSDNGAGFDMATATKLFEPFRRLHSVEEFEGTGIGLATVQRVIERHGGRIWADAAVGQGATFSFTLGIPVPFGSAHPEPVGAAEQ